MVVRFEFADLDEAVIALTTAPFRFLTEVDKRASRSVEHAFFATVRTVMRDFEAHTDHTSPCNFIFSTFLAQALR